MKIYRFFLSGLICFSATSCKIEHVHDPIPPPSYEEPQSCVIAYSYRDNGVPGVIDPVVTCSVRNADSYAYTECYMEFRANAFPRVTRQSFKTADFFGNADISISNGNCDGGLDTIKIQAECIVDGERLNVLDTGYITCGA